MDSTVRRLLEDFHFFLEALAERGLLIDANNLVPRVSKSGTVVTWGSGANLSYLFSEYASIGQYVQMLENRDFCLCLSDGALIQIAYLVEEGEVQSHRLCYVPCPFEYNSAEWPGFTLSEIPAMMAASDFLYSARLASAVRFDFDANHSDGRHAHSHVTINKATCRIPAYGPISLGHFFRLILRYFYEEHFDIDSWSDAPRPQLYARTLSHPSPHEIHIESAIGYM